MSSEKYKIGKNIVFDTLDEETGLVVDSENNLCYEVTSTVCYILQLLKTPRGFNSIKEKMLAEYDVDEDTLEADLKEILKELCKNNIIEKCQ